jgi:hypothetical protein
MSVDKNRTPQLVGAAIHQSSKFRDSLYTAYHGNQHPRDIAANIDRHISALKEVADALRQQPQHDWVRDGIQLTDLPTPA